MATLTSPFKIKCCLKRAEFAKVAYFSVVNVPAKHKNTTYASEDIILAGGRK